MSAAAREVCRAVVLVVRRVERALREASSASMRDLEVRRAVCWARRGWRAEVCWVRRVRSWVVSVWESWERRAACSGFGGGGGGGLVLLGWIWVGKKELLLD